MGWWVGGLVGWLVGWLVDSPTDFLTCDTISSSPKNNRAFQG